MRAGLARPAPPPRHGRRRRSRTRPSNVADGAIVEVGATVDADGIHPDAMPPIAEPIAEPIAGHIATQVALQDLVVRAALTGDKALALQAVIEDPASPRDPGACRAMFDELVARQAPELRF